MMVMLGGLAGALILDEEEALETQNPAKKRRAPKRKWERPYIVRRREEVHNTLHALTQELIDVSVKIQLQIIAIIFVRHISCRQKSRTFK